MEKEAASTPKNEDHEVNEDKSASDIAKSSNVRGQKTNVKLHKKPKKKSHHKHNKEGKEEE